MNSVCIGSINQTTVVTANPMKTAVYGTLAQLYTCRNGICIPAKAKILVSQANDNIPLCLAHNILESQAYSKELKSLFY